MIIPAPRQVDALIRRIRKGRVATVNDLRSALAREHGTEIACPITTGIFSWMAAQAAEEAAAAGRTRITPWWRVLKGEGELNSRFPGGTTEQASRLRAEGHQVIPARRGSKLVVQDVDRVRAKLG
jgi:alkylated DNA nucleotide flippase Atl1